MEIVLISKQIIDAELKFDDRGVVVNSATVMFLGQIFKELEVKDNKVSFEITSQFENGNYEVVYHATINGKGTDIHGSFVVTNDKIDPSLPVDLQNLKNEIQSI